MICNVRVNSGVRGILLSMLIPTARLAATTVNGLLAAAGELVYRPQMACPCKITSAVRWTSIAAVRFPLGADHPCRRHRDQKLGNRLWVETT